ncbi:uncharacterized protein LOC123525262 isoform X2 [Mercenaria mercenaria]|uniref:uncharacterized protein LOC123525262 isoform X2 n=1 Tax=Mercenaria mercenaria TaxID=6596 RepID=UPI00234F7858|nr:uncharacterized protein LOC123525262 isoform X2 [Mercenaria mercenaria]
MNILKNSHACNAAVQTLLCILLSHPQRIFAVSICDKIKSASAEQGPDMPYIPENFQVNVEANIMNKLKTVSAKLYFDYPGNRASLKLLENGIDGRIIFNFQTDEIYKISGGICTTSQLSTSDYIQWFGMNQMNGKIHINSSKSALHFGNQFGEVFVGKEYVRGIEVNHWISCPSIPSWNNFTIDYYFSASNWSTASTVPSAPLKAEVNGSKTFANGTVYNMYHIYDYYNYIPGIDDVDDAIFQTPTNVACSGRKQGKPLPKLPQRFYYRTERIYTDLSTVTFEDTWYDETFKLFRRDYHPLMPVYPIYTTHPITEIHDYKTGVRYVIDKSYGNCTTTALPSNLMDASLNITASKYNGSFVINMKNPLQLFHLNWNYTYIGQNQVRDILCDTYVAVAQNLTINGFVSNQKTVITFYFSAQEWTHVYDSDKGMTQTAVPVKMDVVTSEIGFSTTFNFLDFDPNPPTLDVFDINKCFFEANKITFQLKFPGTLSSLEVPAIKEWTHLVLAEKMEVSILRISNINLDYDDANVFVSATLLDKTAYSAQFTKIEGKKMETRDDQIIYKTSSSVKCASYCVNNPSFICNSFDVCSDDTTCHLSKRHTDDGVVINTVKTCDHYSRNVNGILPEKSIADAYQLLRTNVYNSSLQLNRLGNKVYTAVDVTLTFGWVTPNKNLPAQLSDAYSYEVEVSIPADEHVYTIKVSYDDGFQMIRYEPHYNRVVYPYYTTNPLSIVEDYNTGIKYVTDKVYRNCTVTQIGQHDFGAIMSPDKSTNSTYKLFIKDPLQLFYIDDTYFFVGQQTVRGMTCNVFESLRKDFIYNNKVVNAIFRYSFLSDDWMEISEGYLGGAVGQPVRLEITVLQPTFYMEYNFYNFDTDHPDLSVFDVPHCYKTQNTKQFQITFPGKYEEYLSTSTKMFLIEATFIMSRLSGASIHRFQRTRLDHDNDNIYLTSSLVEQPNKMLYFTRMRSGYVPEHVDKVEAVPESPSECATSCFSNTDFMCNSFYVCVASNQCLLSAKHVPDGPNQTHTTCISYSRTVNNSTAEVTNLVAFLNLQNAVFTNNLTLKIPIPGTDKNKIFSATYIKDVFLSDKLHDNQDNALLNFDIHSLSTVIPVDESLTFLDVGSCASACLKQNAFQCHGFSYCLNKYLCVMSKTHPDQINNNTIQSQVNCTTYNRKYMNEFAKVKGVIPLAYSAIPFGTTETDEKCAQMCSKNIQCRMFEYCTNTRQCVMYDERNFGQQSNLSLTACNLFTSPYDKDFQSNNAGSFTFTSVISFQGITKSDCARNCVQLQKSKCTRFYFSVKTTTCYLPGDSGIVTVANASGVGDFCDEYKRTFFPRSDNVPTAATYTRPKPVVISSASTYLASSVTQKITKSSASTLQNTVTNSQTSTSTKSLPCSSLQRQSSSDSKHTTGTTVGVAVGTFLLGLLIGAAGLYLFNKYRNLDKDGLKTNFIEHEDM